MDTKPSYADLADAIARCLYQELAAVYVDGRPVAPWNGPAGEPVYVDNMASSQFQIATGVLNRLGILKPLDDIAMHNEFTCPLDECHAIAARNEAQGCGYDTLVMALVLLLEEYPNDTAVYAILARLGVCEPDTAPPYDKGARGAHIRWTSAKEKYDAMYNSDWPKLLES